MAKKPLCEFGKRVKLRLNEENNTQKWLIEEVKKTTGLYFDSGYMHRILTGKSRNPKIITAICHLLIIYYSE